jgi:hypothetical protein
MNFNLSHITLLWESNRNVTIPTLREPVARVVAVRLTVQGTRWPGTRANVVVINVRVIKHRTNVKVRVAVV